MLPSFGSRTLTRVAAPSHPKSDESWTWGSEHFQGGGLGRPLLDIGVQSSSQKGEAAGLALLF